MARCGRRFRLRGWHNRGLFWRGGLGGLGFSAFAFEFNERLPHFEVISLAHEESCDFPGGRRRHRHGRLVGLELDQRLSCRDLIAFMHEHLNDIAPFNTVRKKW